MPSVDESSSQENVASNEDNPSHSMPSYMNTKPDQDWLLCWLVWLANKLGISQGVTLNVGGTVVSGTIISGKEYFESVGGAVFQVESIPVNANEEIIKSVADSLRGFACVYNNETEEPEGTPAPGYIHLKDVRTISQGGQTITFNGALWRGKIASIDAFILGSAGG